MEKFQEDLADEVKGWNVAKVKTEPANFEELKKDMKALEENEVQRINSFAAV